MEREGRREERRKGGDHNTVLISTQLGQANSSLQSLDWTGGLTFFVLKVTFVLSCETSHPGQSLFVLQCYPQRKLLFTISQEQLELDISWSTL